MTSSDPPLLRLPLEVTDKIADDLRNNRDLMAFASTCPSITERYYLPAVVSQLVRHSLQSMVAPDTGDRFYTTPELFCLSNAGEGEPGYAPFMITSAVLSPDRDHVTVGITSPVFTRFIKDVPTRDYFFVHVEIMGDGRATMYPNYVKMLRETNAGVFKDPDEFQGYGRVRPPTAGDVMRSPAERDLEVNTVSVDWRKKVAGRLVPATRELLAQRFVCPECKGLETYQANSSYDPRWPMLTAAFPDDDCESWTGSGDSLAGLDMNHTVVTVCCPRCVGHEQAMEDIAEHFETTSVYSE